MYGTIEVGKYNVDYKGDAWGGKIRYELIGIQEFVGDTPVGKEKFLYFCTGKDCIIPSLGTEEEIEQFLEYHNYARLRVRKQIVIEEV